MKTLQERGVEVPGDTRSLTEPLLKSYVPLPLRHAQSQFVYGKADRTDCQHYRRAEPQGLPRSRFEIDRELCNRPVPLPIGIAGLHFEAIRTRNQVGIRRL